MHLEADLGLDPDVASLDGVAKFVDEMQQAFAWPVDGGRGTRPNLEPALGRDRVAVHHVKLEG